MATATERILAHWRKFQLGHYQSDSMPAKLLRYYGRTLLGQWLIRDVHGSLVPMRHNEVQVRVLAAMLDQAARGMPIRINILKSRKTGVSTETETLAVDLCAYEKNQKAITIAHADTPTREIFEIAKLAAEAHQKVRPCDITAELKWPDTRSHYFAMTAGGTAVGAGGTPSFVHTSEGPKWDKNKEQTFYNVVNSVPYVPETIIIHEFTAKGRDLFYQLFDDARHDPNHQYVSIFIAWYLDSTLVSPVPDGFQADEDEVHLRGRAHKDGYELSDAQLQWRRNKIAEIGPDLFRQEYPSTPEEAIQGAKGLIFPHMRECMVYELPFDPKEIPWSDRVGGADFGYNDPTAIWTGFYVDQELWITGFWRQQETLADQQVEACHQGHHYFCDPANLTERTALTRACQAAGLQCRFSAAPRRKNPGEDTARIEMQNVLKMMSQGRLHIMYNVAAQLIVECDSLCWNEATGKPDDKRTDACAHYDSIKSLTYLVMGVMNRGKVEPKDADRPRILSRRQQFQRFG